MSKYPWARGLNIPNETISMWEMQAGQSDLLRWALANNKINEFTYQDWAKVYYQLPTLDVKFFDQSPKPELWERWGSYAWSGSFLPIYEWDGVLYIACLEPPNEKQKELVASLEVKVGFLIAPISGMKKWWSILSPTIQYQNTNMHLPPELAAFSSGGSAVTSSPQAPAAVPNVQQLNTQQAAPVSEPVPTHQANYSAPVNGTASSVSQAAASAPVQGVVAPVARQEVNPVAKATTNEVPVDPFAGFPQEIESTPDSSYQAPGIPRTSTDVQDPPVVEPPVAKVPKQAVSDSASFAVPSPPSQKEEPVEIPPVPSVSLESKIPMSPPVDLPPPVELSEEELELEIDTGFNAAPSLEEMKLDTEIPLTPPVDALAHTSSSFDAESASPSFEVEAKEQEEVFEQDIPTAPNIPQAPIAEEPISVAVAEEPEAASVSEPPLIEEEAPSLDFTAQAPEIPNEELKIGDESGLGNFDPSSLLNDSEEVAMEEEFVLKDDSEEEAIEGLEGLSFGDSQEEESSGLEGLNLDLSGESAPEEMSMDTLSGVSTTTEENALEGLDLNLSINESATEAETQSNMPPSAHLVPDEEDDMLANLNSTPVASNVAPLKVAHPKLTNTEVPQNANHVKKEPQDKEEEMAYRALNQFADYFEKVMVLQVHQMMLKPYVWNDAWTQNKNMNANVDLSMGSIFRIVFTSRKPYHGYVVRNPINDSFFNAFNKGQLPEHATIVPVSLDGNLVAMILGFTSQQNADSLSLEECERIADNYAKDIKDFYKSQANAA
jgi:hypothetical protein